MMRRFFLLLALGLALGSASVYAQTVRQVSHTPSGAQYGSIAAAYADCAEGDIIEIADNSAIFEEDVTIQKNSITLRAADGLDPAPQLRSATDSWTLVVQGSGCVVENLSFLSGNWGAVDALSGDLTLRGCAISAARAGGGLGSWSVMAQYVTALTMESCTISSGGVHGLNISNDNTVVTVSNSLITGVTGEAAVKLIGASQLAMTGCTLTGNSGVAIMIQKTADAAQTQQVDLTETVLTPGAATANSQVLMQYYSGAVDATSNLILNVTNCDFIAGPATPWILGMNDGARAAITIRKTIYAGGVWAVQAFGNVPQLYSEDYNVYQNCANTADWVGATAGAHSLTIATDAALYVDAAAGDYRVDPVSAAATIDPTGNPVYAGSQGVGPGSGAKVLQVTHTPTAEQYNSVQAAIDAAADGDTVEIIDNSAPFVEDVIFDRNSITLRGATGLNPQPIIQSDPNGTVGNTITSNIGTGMIIENLKLVGGEWTALQAVGGGTMTLRNCTLDGTRAANKGQSTWAVLSINKPLVFENCKLLYGKVSVLTLDQTTTVSLTNCQLSDASGAGIRVVGSGTVIANGCTLTRNLGPQVVVDGVTAAAGPGSHISLTDTLLSCGISGNAEPVIIYYSKAAGVAGLPLVLNVDNCDLIGTGSTNFGFLAVSGPQATVNFVDSIFYNFVSTFDKALTTDNLTAASEDYCVYQKAPGLISNLGGTAGAHSSTLAAADSLYVNATTGDFRVNADSVAATLNSTGTPVYAGSQGVAPTTVQYGWPVPAARVGSAAPVIDGAINVAGEYSPLGEAYCLDLRMSTLDIQDPYYPAYTHKGSNADDLTYNNTESDADLSAKMYFLWDDQALYVAVEAKDDSRESAQNPSVNAGDCFQLCLDYDQVKATDGSQSGAKNYIPSWSIRANTGTAPAGNDSANFQQFWPSASVNPMTGTTWAVTTAAGGYTLEARIPWTALTAGGDSFTKPFPPAPGQKAGVLPLLCDFDDAAVAFMHPAAGGVGVIANASKYIDMIFIDQKISAPNAASGWEMYQ